MKGFKLYIITGTVLLIIYLVAQFNKPVPTDWTPTFATKDKIPFGTYLLFNKLGDMVPGAKITKTQEPAYNTLKGATFNAATYLIVAPRINLDTNDYVQLVKFAEAGNFVFIAASDVGKFMAKKLKIGYNTGFGPILNEGRQAVNFTNPALRSPAFYEFDKNIGSQYFDKIDTARAIVLGVTKAGKANFVKYPVKEGAIFLLADASFFTNYNILAPQGATYAGKVLSYIGKNNNVLFDEYFTLGGVGEQDLLRFFFKNPPLKYAYWLTVAGFLLFLFFEIKRRQRVIPVADPFTNTSVEFVNVVSSVYYNQRNNRNIAEKKIAYFFDHLRTRYFWKINQADDDFAQVLQQKTGISETLAKSLSMQIRYIGKETHVHDSILINLNNLIESFYNESK